MNSKEAINGEKLSGREASSRRRTIAALASLALIAPLYGCSAEDGEGLPQRNAPSSGPYSTDANQVSNENVAAAQDYAGPDRLPALETLSRQAVAEWLPDEPGAAVADIRRVVKRSSSDGSIPVFVSYAIPNRDLGGHSTGGLSQDQYTDYVQDISNAIGRNRAIVVVEPDALAQIPEMTGNQRTERMALLADAIDAFGANKNTAVYLDAGNSRWRSPDETASLLRDVADRSTNGISGIALNVSNYQATGDTRDYAKEVMDAYGKQLYVLTDTSRNGAAETSATTEWCNPENQKLGSADPDFDASNQFEEVYVKVPGESDGICGISDRPAGEFDGDLLLRQIG